MSAIGEQIKALTRPGPAWITLAAALGLTALGISAIETVSPGFAASQKRNLPIALLGMLIAMLPHPRLLGHLAYPMLGFAIALLIFVLLTFVPRSIVPVVNGARSWIDLKVMYFQPSEMAKVFYVLSLAWYLRYRRNHRTVAGLLVPFGFMLVPVILILKEPDLGTALVFGPALFVMLVAAGARLAHLGTLVLVGVLAIGINIAVVLWAPQGMQLLKPHQQDRIRSMISLARGDTRYIDSDAYQQNKAMMLVGAGGIRGYGGEQATLVLKYNRLPEAHNDMIFAVIACRWGLLGAAGVLALYSLLIGSFLAVAARSKDPFARLSCVGFSGIIFTQALVNIGMTVGVLPITGITLPFLSYGGSSLLFSFAMVGLVLNFASRKPSMMARESFEFR